MYLILLQRIRTSPKYPIFLFFAHSSELINLIFKYESEEIKVPLYSMPHFSLIKTRWPSKDFIYFFGLILEYLIKFFLVIIVKATWRSG